MKYVPNWDKKKRVNYPLLSIFHLLDLPVLMGGIGGGVNVGVFVPLLREEPVVGFGEPVGLGDDGFVIIFHLTLNLSVCTF